MTPLLLALCVAQVPPWFSREPTCERTTCVEPMHVPCPDGMICGSTLGSMCTGDLVAIPCSTPCLLRFCNRDGGCWCGDGTADPYGPPRDGGLPSWFPLSVEIRTRMDGGRE
ncbi:MAG TPA: hypothetical protein VET26_00775 [Candidatus Sulfotelmatobacter sp.]|nr:hypothetical protein [Candidatus Sulfotelmatobacter sp.]